MLFFFDILWYLKQTDLVDFSCQEEKFPMDALDLRILVLYFAGIFRQQ